MPSDVPFDLPPGPWPVAALLLGGLCGTAVQLAQPALHSASVYGAWLAVAGLWGALAWAVGKGRLGARSAAGRQGRAGRSGGWARTAWPWGLWFAAAALALWAVCGLRAVAFVGQALAPELEGQDLRVTGIVAAMPQGLESGLRLRLAVQSAEHQGRPVRLPPLIDLAWYAPRAEDPADGFEPQRPPAVLRAGERWVLAVRLKAPHGLRNPHGFDYELWLWEQGVQATGTVRAGPRDPAPLRLAATWRYPVEQARQAVRDAIARHLAWSAAPTEARAARLAGVVAALVTGDQRAIERPDWELFRATGVAHLMSISGLHITLFAWLAAAVVRWLWSRSPRLCLAWPAPSAALLAGVLLATAYAVFSGWGVPAQRTVTMLATVAVLRLGGRRWPWPQVGLLACAAVVLVDPWALRQSGFWLSFVAVGILFATDSGAHRAGGTGFRGHFYALVREQWVVTLALTPLGLLLFGQVSWVGFAANLVAIPWVTLVVTPLALGGVLWAPLWSLSAWSLQPLVAGLHWLAEVPQAVGFFAAPPLWAGVAAVAGGALLALRLPWQVRALALPLCLPLLWWQPARPAPGQFDLLAPDVGQGSAVLVRTARHTLLYDTGPRWSRETDAGQRVLVPLLRAQGERVDLLMLSHSDADHTGGAAAVLAQQPQARLAGSIADDPVLQALRPATPCAAGQRWQWDGVDFEVLHPVPGTARPAGRSADNALSCVLRIAAAGAGGTALLVGDIEIAQEQALLARRAPLAADLLLVPHHGSKTSSIAAFLDAVQPRQAWVQAGYRNRYGHPAPDVLQRYQARHIRVVESPRCGAAFWSSEAPDAVACERETAARYWQHRLGPAAP
ncbi:MAG: DNA internalization-related competence protein ComEC/Rec2 [Burkholderiaceae bacterium]|nr:DNA internalization-related competence protein ComEC/Rec2 [Burkholderiaceae bacterium]